MQSIQNLGLAVVAIVSGTIVDMKGYLLYEIFNLLCLCGKWLYAVKAQTSLAPLSRFRGSRITTAHAHQCCRFQSYAKTVPSQMKLTNEIDDAWTNIHGIHDNGPRDHGVWRLTLTAY